MDKITLRKSLIKKRINLSKDTVVKKSAQATLNLLSLNLIEKNNNFAVYLPINNEADTKQFIKWLFENKKRVVLPTCDKKSKSYFFAEFKGFGNLEKGPFGVKQVKNPVKFDERKLDVLIVPGVAFSSSGLRLGYGYGVYDKLIKNLRAIKIGLAYDFQLIKDLPIESRDATVDIVVTEKRIIRVI